MTRRDRRAVDEDADGRDQILVDRPLAVIEALRVLAEQHQFIGGRQLRDDRAAQRPLRIVRAPPPPAIVPAASSRGWPRRSSRSSARMPATRSRIRMPVVSSWPEPLARAYAACERLAQSHYENFPVASRLLPAPMRPHVAAVYAFARGADDIADEGVASRRGAAGTAARLAEAAARCGRRRSRRRTRRGGTRTWCSSRSVTRFGRSICRCRSSTIC